MANTSKIKFLSRWECLGLFIATVLLPVAFYYNAALLLAVQNLRVLPLNNIMLFVTKEGLALLIGLGFGYAVFKKKYAALAIILLALAMSIEFGYLLKKVFQIPRPYATETFAYIALKTTSGYSFPSLHAVFCLTVIPFLNKIFKKRLSVFLASAILIVIVTSRIYLGLHYMSDLIAGGIIGFLAAKFWLYLDGRYNFITWFLAHIKDKLEMRRQIAHAVTGIVLIFLIKIGVVTVEVLAIILVFGSIFVTLSKNYRVPVLYHFLKYFERSKELQYFPGKGAFFFVLGSLAALLFFEKNIAMASIAVMAIGDATTTLIGTYFGKIKNPLNREKHLEGSVLAIIFSTLAAFTFVPFPLAFLGSVAGIVFESVTVKFVDRVIDDNLLIPIIAGLVMTALG